MRGVSAGKPAQVTGDCVWNACFARKSAQERRTDEVFSGGNLRRLRVFLHEMRVSPVNSRTRGEHAGCFCGKTRAGYGRLCMERVFRP